MIHYNVVHKNLKLLFYVQSLVIFYAKAKPDSALDITVIEIRNLLSLRILEHVPICQIMENGIAYTISDRIL